MKFRTLIRRSLRFHWRSHLGVVLGAAIGSAALIGALVVGDSVQGSLRARALERLGPVAFALGPHDRFFRDELGFGIYSARNYSPYWNLSSNRAAYFGEPQPVTALLLPGMASRADGSARANQVNVLGVCLYVKPEVQGKWLGDLEKIPAGEIWLNAPLAAQLQANLGTEIILRLPQSKGGSAEVAVSSRSASSHSLRLKLTRILTSAEMGDFNLQPTQQPTFNAFVNLQQLQGEVGLADQANQLLFSSMYETKLSPGSATPSDGPQRLYWAYYRAVSKCPNWLANLLWKFAPSNQATPPREPDAAVALPVLAQALETAWKLADTETELKPVGNPPQLNLATKRVFLDPPIIRSALTAEPSAHPILTYLATLLRAGTNATPYSMITAAGAPWTPAGLRDEEIVVSQWLANDLRVKPGDELALSYFLPESGAKLVEATNTFRVHSIVPMELPWADRTLMPDFPGIEKAESTSDWDAGFPLTYEVRKQDDDYWKQYRGTPKAFITLAAGQKMWGNRFGNLTAIRFPIPPHLSATNYQRALETRLLAHLKPEELGLRFEPVRAQALQAASGSQDFGGLFLGFSFFLILAALLLMAMLFQFGLEQRTPELGTLLALGFTPNQVRRIFLREAAALACGGGIIGAVGGIYFARAMLHGLSTIWRDAVGATSLQFHVTTPTLLIGILASTLVSTGTLWLALRKFLKYSPRELLAGDLPGAIGHTRKSRSYLVGSAALVLALGLSGGTLMKGDQTNAGVFFGAGALTLIAGLSFVTAWLAGQGGSNPSATTAGAQPFSALALAVRGCARRRKRSLATVTMLAGGSFLIISISVFRLDAQRGATEKNSGTGGFALLGGTTLPVVQDLNAPSGLDFFALSERDLAGVTVVPLRVRAGDEASCLNLNAAPKPKLVGVNPEQLSGRFSFVKLIDDSIHDQPWRALAEFYPKSGPPLATNEIAAIGDANSIQWAMHKKVGDTIDYLDERGQPFKVRIIGAVANSILQGQLLIDEAEFVKRFPNESGYRMFLIDAPSNTAAQVSATLSRALQDVGLELTPTAVRLNQFNAVQNTYLGTFQVLGGLGLLLGSVGLGIVVMRNVLERRSELAVLLAVGFRKQQVQRLLLLENGALLVAGLAIGMVAAGIAVLPALWSPAAQLPVTSLTLTLAAVLLNGALWTWVATRYAVRGDLLAALRNE